MALIQKPGFDTIGRIDKYVQFESNYNSIRAEFGEVRTRLLEAPYDSNCKNYDRSLCRNLCVATWTKNLTGLWSSLVSISNKDTPTNRQMVRTDLMNKIQQEIDKSIRRQCQSECPESECSKTFYTLTEKRTMDKFLSRNHGNVTRLSIVTSRGLRTTSVEMAMMTMVEFACILGSVINFWFGWSVLMLRDVIFQKRKIRKLRLNQIDHQDDQSRGDHRGHDHHGHGHRHHRHRRHHRYFWGEKMSQV